MQGTARCLNPTYISSSLQFRRSARVKPAGGTGRRWTAVAAAAFCANDLGMTNPGVLGKAAVKALVIGLGTLQGGGDDGGNGFHILGLAGFGIDVQDDPDLDMNGNDGF